MMQPDPIELDPGNYSFHVDLQTRFGDLGHNQQVSPVQIAQLFEEGRLRFVVDVLTPSTSANSEQHRDETLLLSASILTNYLDEVHYPQDVSIASGIFQYGNSSLTISSLMRQSGRVVAHSRVSAVHYKGGKATPLSAENRLLFEPYFIHPRKKA